MPLLTILLALATAGLLLPTTAHAGAILHDPTYVGLGTGLVGFWSFDGEDIADVTAYDRSGSGSNGMLTSGPARAAGKLGQALDFDGVASNVNFGDVIEPNFITISAWVKPSVVAVDQRIVSKWGNGSAERQYLLSTNDNTANTFTFAVRSADGIGDICDSSGASGTYVANQWYFVLRTYDGTTCHIYVNSIDVTSVEFDNASGNIWNTSTNLRIGFEGDLSGVPFSGTIDEVRIYNRALSADEIKRLYKIGATAKFGVTSSTGSLTSGLVGYWSFNGPDIAGDIAYDRSGQGNNGTLTNGPTGIRGKIGQALDFDGVDDGVDVSSGGPPSNFVSPSEGTLSAWIKPNATQQDAAQVAQDPMIIGNDLNSGGGFLGIYIDPSNISFYHYDGSTDTVTTAWTPDTWIHVVWVHAGGNLYGYRNGVLVGSTASGNTENLSLGTMTVGGTLNDLGGYEFNGVIDDVIIYNRALSQDEIKRLYKIGATAKQGVAPNNGTLASGLVGYWTFDGPDIADVTAYDRSGQGNNGTLTNGPTRVRGKLGQALQFDGINDHVSNGVDVVNLISVATGTFSVWLRPTGPSLETGGGAFNLPPILGDTGGVMGIHRGAILGSDKIWVYNWDGNEDVVSVSYNPDEWVHIAWVHANGTLSGYKNGQLFGSVASGNTTLGDEDLLIGAGYVIGQNRFFTGQIDDVRIYNRALTPDEIKRLYNMGR
jgi:hypothetical protein